MGRYLLVVVPHRLCGRRRRTGSIRTAFFSRPARNAFGARAALNATMVLAMMGCGVDRVPSTSVKLFDEAAGTVVTRRLAFDTLWVYGGAGDTIMLNADRVAAFPDGDAAVLDLLGRQVHRVGVGGVAWSWGTRGEGPGEIDHVRDLEVSSEGEVVLADSGNGRLHWLAGDGTWLREVVLPEGTINVDAVAALEDGHYILSSLMYGTALATLDSTPLGPIAANRWVRVSAEGEIEGLVPFPWDCFRSMSFFQTVGDIAGARSLSASSGRWWVFGFGLGNGFFVFNDSVAEAYPYVRHADFPEVEMGGLGGGRDGFRVGYRDGRPDRVARDVAIRGDTVYVLAGNHWEMDRYESTTGQYLDSVLLPVPLSRFALARDALVGVVAGEMYPQVIALRAK